MNSPLLSVVTALAAIAAPGVFSWVRGRELLHDPDDPALPEKLVSQRGRVLGVAVAAAVVAAFVIPTTWLPLLCFGMYLATLVGSFPARRTLFRETWSLASYVGFRLRALVAFVGPSLLLAFTPALVASRTGVAAYVTAGLLFVAVVVWQRAFPAVLRWLLEIRELDRPDLAPRLADVVSRSRVSAPRLLVLDPQGGRTANALALPRRRPPSTVMFTRTLLDELTPDETAAIFAHEVAHLEHYDAKRLTKIAVAQAVIAFLVSTIALLLPEEWQPWRTQIALVIAPVIIAAVIAGVARRRTHEGESDLRAVELSGNAEALASALAKLHALARLPRRVASESESMRSHPSLARRLQAIRSAGGTATSSDPFVPLVVRGEPGKFLVLERGRAHWLEGVAEVPDPIDLDALRLGAAVAKSYAYAELGELRLDVARGRPSVVARGRGEKWSFAVPSADTATIRELQAKLDELDGKLAPARVSTRKLDGVSPLVSIALLLLSMVAVPSLPALVAAALAVFQPAAATLAAAAGASLAAAVIALRAASALPALLPIAAVLAFAVLELVAAHARSGDDAEREAWRARLAVAALLVAGIPSALGLGVTFFEQEAPSLRMASRFPGMTVALVGIAFALLATRRRSLAAVAALTAFVPFAAALQWESQRASGDPLASAPQVALAPLAANAVARVAEPERAAAIRLSPSGGVLAVELLEYGADDDDDPLPISPRFQIGSLGAPAASTTVEALEIAFVDDRRLLALVGTPAGTELREIDVADPSRAGWHLAVPYLVQPHLAVERGSGSFRLVGKEPRLRAYVRIRGRVGEDAVTQDRWTTPAGFPFTFYEWFATDGGRALAVGMRMPKTTGVIPPWIFALLDPSLLYRHELWTIGGGGEPKRVASGSLTLSCAQPELGARSVFCTTMEDRSTRLFAVSPSDDSVTPLATVSHVFMGAQAAISGKRLAAASGGEVVLLDLGSPNGRVLPVGSAGRHVYARDVALSETRLAVLTEGDGTPSVLFFDLPS